MALSAHSMMSTTIVTLLALVAGENGSPRRTADLRRTGGAARHERVRITANAAKEWRGAYSPFAPMRLIFKVFVLPRRPNG